MANITSAVGTDRWLVALLWCFAVVIGLSGHTAGAASATYCNASLAQNNVAGVSDYNGRIAMDYATGSIFLLVPRAIAVATLTVGLSASQFNIEFITPRFTLLDGPGSIVYSANRQSLFYVASVDSSSGTPSSSVVGTPVVEVLLSPTVSVVVRVERVGAPSTLETRPGTVLFVADTRYNCLRGVQLGSIAEVGDGPGDFRADVFAGSCDASIAVALDGSLATARFRSPVAIALGATYDVHYVIDGDISSPRLTRVKESVNAVVTLLSQLWALATIPTTAIRIAQLESLPLEGSSSLLLIGTYLTGCMPFVLQASLVNDTATQASRLVLFGSTATCGDLTAVLPDPSGFVVGARQGTLSAPLVATRCTAFHQTMQATFPATPTFPPQATGSPTAAASEVNDMSLIIGLISAAAVVIIIGVSLGGFFVYRRTEAQHRALVAAGSMRSPQLSRDAGSFRNAAHAAHSPIVSSIQGLGGGGELRDSGRASFGQPMTVSGSEDPTRNELNAFNDGTHVDVRGSGAFSPREERGIEATSGSSVREMTMQPSGSGGQEEGAKRGPPAPPASERQIAGSTVRLLRNDPSGERSFRDSTTSNAGEQQQRAAPPQRDGGEVGPQRGIQQEAQRWQQQREQPGGTSPPQLPLFLQNVAIAASRLMSPTSAGSRNGGSNSGGSESLLTLPRTSQVDAIRGLVLKHAWQKTRLLGRGANGSVYACLLADGSTIAVKEIMLMSEQPDSQVKEMQREVEIMSAVTHPSVVQYYVSTLDRNDMVLRLFMELITGGSLGALVRSMERPLPEPILKRYVYQITAALAYLHSKGIVHRDLKADNVLLSTDGAVKLADFGTATNVGLGTSAVGAQTMIGTPLFMAPEILSGLGDDDESDGPTANGSAVKKLAGYGTKADIWSFGIMVCELGCQGQLPWPQFASVGQAFLYISGPNGKPVIPATLCPGTQAFVRRCLYRDPRKRSPAASLLSDPWFDNLGLASPTAMAAQPVSTQPQVVEAHSAASGSTEERGRSLEAAREGDGPKTPLGVEHQVVAAGALQGEGRAQSVGTASSGGIPATIAAEDSVFPPVPPGAAGAPAAACGASSLQRVASLGGSSTPTSAVLPAAVALATAAAAGPAGGGAASEASLLVPLQAPSVVVSASSGAFAVTPSACVVSSLSSEDDAGGGPHTGETTTGSIVAPTTGAMRDEPASGAVLLGWRGATAANNNGSRCCPSKPSPTAFDIFLAASPASPVLMSTQRLKRSTSGGSVSKRDTATAEGATGVVPSDAVDRDQGSAAVAAAGVQRSTASVAAIHNALAGTTLRSKFKDPMGGVLGGGGDGGGGGADAAGFGTFVIEPRPTSSLMETVTRVPASAAVGGGLVRSSLRSERRMSSEAATMNGAAAVPIIVGHAQLPSPATSAATA